MTTQPKKCSSPRDLTVKTYLNPDEFIPFRDKCEAAGVAVAARIRILINRDISEANRSKSRRQMERPSLGPVRALFPAARGRFGGAPVPRLRL